MNTNCKNLDQEFLKELKNMERICLKILLINIKKL